MSQIIQTQKGKKKSSFIEFLKKECVLVIAVTLAILSSCIYNFYIFNDSY